MKTRDTIDIYGQWLADRQRDGFDPFLMTLMFSHIRGSELTVRREMEQAVCQLYSRALTRIIRNPRASSDKLGWPLWIVVPDFPGPTWFKLSRSDVSINGGRHMHAVAMIPPKSRLRSRFNLHMLEGQERYLQPPLLRVDVRPITHHLEYTVDYAMKGLKRLGISGDDILILPRV